MKTNVKTFAFLFALVAFFGFSHTANAHLAQANGFLSGITHPLLGLDHLLAAIAVGIISAQIGGKATKKIPATFLFFMIVGVLLAVGGLPLPMVEMGVALSVLIFGVFIVISKKIPMNGAILCIAFFAIFHGHAHGEEMSFAAHSAFSVIGLLFSTTLLHILGVFIGSAARKAKSASAVLRYTGAGIRFKFRVSP